VEEVARLHGYDKIGLGWSFRTTTYGQVDPFDRFVESVADHLCARGHLEVVTSSFCEGGEAEVFGWEGPRASAVPIVNPLSARHRFLRTSLLPGLLDVVRRNMDRGTRRLELFTIGRVFQRDGEEGLPHERVELLLARTQPEGPDFWNHSRTTADLFDLKEELESLAAAHRVDLDGRFAYEFDMRTGGFRYNEERETVIEGGIVPPSAAERYGLDQALWFAVVDMQALYEARAHRATFKPIAEYPPSKRDLSLVTPSGVTYAQIEKTLVKHAGRLLESVQVFDVYTGERLPEGSTAFGVRLCFRSSQGTLRDADVDAVVARVIEKLKIKLGVVLRT
jgi:phenylalanyl-tRNA synthetase beta chain